MKNDRKSPEFSTSDYVRPNLSWECGHLCDGCPCRIGPSPSGKCRATYECQPFLKVQEGEEKGRYVCTRPKSGGGKCENGPLPDGTCCNAIQKCQPRRTLRNIRTRLVVFTVIATILTIFIGISRDAKDDFINPGPISNVHASKQFAKVHHDMSGDRSSCAACHVSAKGDVSTWYRNALDAFQGDMSPRDLIKEGPIESSAMDASCLSCHEGKKFHQPNMAAEFACHECHKEHQGSGFMVKVHSNYCTECHGSAKLMAESREIGTQTNPHAFPIFSSTAGEKIAPRERPEGGYTQVINSFYTDHPEFQQIREGTKDKNTLKFNHAVHLSTGEIPRQLSCSDCHEQDGKGEYQLPITFEKHCVECHTLQFDPKTPELHLPHGDPVYVRSFLRSLNIQYEEYARSKLNLTLRDQLNAYVLEKREDIEKLYETGENLERAVFFADMHGKLPGGEKVPVAGCATCHEVAEPKSNNATPDIAKVSVPVRWMTLGSFDHNSHLKGLSCVDCHDVMKSQLTSDLNLPSIKSCIDCHSPKGGIDHQCTTCHSYHKDQPVNLFPTKAPVGGNGADTQKD